MGSVVVAAFLALLLGLFAAPGFLYVAAALIVLAFVRWLVALMSL